MHKYGLFAIVLLLTYEVASQTTLTPVVEILFKSEPATVTIEKAGLKYNKDFALSLHLDDGHRDIYTHAFSLLEGGDFQINNKTMHSGGMYFSDGCGNLHSFKMASAIYSFSTYNQTDLHGPAAGLTWVKWQELAQMIDAGWAVFNHGHTDRPADDILCSLYRNHSYVRRKLAENGAGQIDMKVISLPFGNTDYIDPAHDANYDLCLWMHDYGVPYLDIKSVNDWRNFSMGIALLDHYDNPVSYVDAIAAESSTTQPKWGCAFTHMITGQQFTFKQFESLLDYIYNSYGANGKDNIWVASAEEVYDYLLVNSCIDPSGNLEQKKYTIEFKGDYPKDLRWYSSSLIIQSDAEIESVIFRNTTVATYCSHSKTTLININWNIPSVDNTYELAEKFIKLTEKPGTQKKCMAEIAIDYIKMSNNPEKRHDMLNKLKAVKDGSDGLNEK